MMTNKDAILITGGSGFIGTNFIELLESKGFNNLLNIDKQKPFNSKHAKYWKECNILDINKFSALYEIFKPTIVVHLAARTDIKGKKLSDYNDNIIGTQNLISIIKSSKDLKRAIFTSTQYVYRPGDVSPKNDTDYNPHTIYGESKVINEKDVRNAALKCNWTIVRPTNIWGPWNYKYKKGLFKYLQLGLFAYPNVGEVMKTYGYVQNIVWQIYQIIELDDDSVNEGVFYLGDVPFNQLDWINELSLKFRNKKVRVIPKGFLVVLAKIGDLCKKIRIPFPMSSLRLINMTRTYSVPISKSFETLGNAPYDMKQAVNNTVNWVKYGDDYKKYC